MFVKVIILVVIVVGIIVGYQAKNGVSLFASASEKADAKAKKDYEKITESTPLKDKIAKLNSIIKIKNLSADKKKEY